MFGPDILNSSPNLYQFYHFFQLYELIFKNFYVKILINLNQLILTKSNKLMELLAERITQSINDLALQIDVLHKLTEKDRQTLLNKIQSFKTTLIGLKSNLKISNKEMIESQFKTVRSEIIEMKRFLDVKLQDLKFKNANQQNRATYQNRLNSCKIGHRTGSITKVNENLFETSNISNNSQLIGSRVGVIKHVSKKEYENLMKNIVEKTQANQELTSQLKTFKQENTQLKEINDALKSKAQLYEKEKQSLQIYCNNLSNQFEIIQIKLKEKQKQTAELKENEVQNRTRISRSALEISQLKNQLDSAQQKLLNYTNFQEVHSYKASLLRDDITKYQRQMSVLNQKHQVEILNFKNKIKQLESYQDKYTQSLLKISKLESQLQNQSEDIEVIEKELIKSQKLYYELKIQKEALQTNIELNRKIFDEKEKQKKSELQMIKQMLVDSEQYNSIKEMQISALKAKLNQWQQAFMEQKHQKQQLEQSLAKSQIQFDKERQSYICDLELKKIQIARLSDQVRKSLDLTKSLQEEINQNHMNRTRIRDDNKLLSNDLKDFEIKNIQLTKSFKQLKKIYLEAIDRLDIMQAQIQSDKKTITLLQNELKQAKIRLHKAKIQAINDIRNTLF